MRWYIQVAVLLAVLFILCDESVEAKKQKSGREGEKAAAKTEYKKDKGQSRKPREVTEGQGKTEKSNKQEAGKNQKEGKKANKIKDGQKFDKKNAKYTKQQKKQGKQTNQEYVDKKTQKYTKNVKKEKVIQNENIVEAEEIEVEEPLNGEIEEDIIAETDTEIIAENEEGEETPNTEVVIDENVEEKSEQSCACPKNKGKKAKEDKVIQCNKKTDSVQRNTTETCQKYKSENNMQVIEETLIAEKQEQPAIVGACDSCKT